MAERPPSRKRGYSRPTPKMEVDQESAVGLQAQAGLNTRLTGQAHQPLTASPNLRRLPAGLPLGYAPITIHRPHEPHPAVDLTPITSAELKAALKELAHNKAPGPDGIPAEAWQWLDEHNQAALLRVLNQSLLTATIPDDWHKAIVVEIYKGKGPLTDPASYRPISLLSTSALCEAPTFQTTSSP